MGYLSGNYLVSVDSQKQTFRFAANVFHGHVTLPLSVAKFLSAVQGSTTLHLDKNKVLMIEELPFSWGAQPTMRQQFYRFLRRAQKCRHLFRRLAHIEHRQNVEDILDS